jgi:hypothetical protein
VQAAGVTGTVELLLQHTLQKCLIHIFGCRWESRTFDQFELERRLSSSDHDISLQEVALAYVRTLQGYRNDQAIDTVSSDRDRLIQATHWARRAHSVLRNHLKNVARALLTHHHFRRSQKL